MAISQETQKSSEALRMVEMVFPNTTNHYGTMFGGKVLDLMDRAAFLASTRFSGQSIVTASMEHIDFYTPVKSGNLVELIAKVVYTGRTSITVKVDLFSENPIQKTREHASQGGPMMHLCRPGHTVLVLGASGEAGALAVHTASRLVGEKGIVIGVMLNSVEKNSFSDEPGNIYYILCGAKDIMGLRDSIRGITNGHDADVVLHCTNISDA